MLPDADRAPDDLLAHAGFVRALARAALRGDGECEDLEQDAWVAALERAPSGPEHRRSWFARVVGQRTIDLLRGRRRRAARERAAARPEPVGSTLDAVERAESGRRLVAAVLSLEEPFRSAVLLRFLDGLAPRHVAAQLGVPVETVRSRVRRGLERLRVLLHEEDRRDGRSWRQGLAALAAPPLAWGTGAALLGALTMKKVLVAAAVVVLVGGGGWWAFEHASDRTERPEARELALETAASPEAGPTLASRATPRMQDPPAGAATPIPSPVPAPRRVWGRVLGDDGTPIAGAVVRNVSYGTDAISAATAEPPVATTCVTDAEGRFELPIDDPRSGSLNVRVFARGWSAAEGRYSRGMVLLTNTKESVVTLVRGVPLSVTVLDDATGAGLAGAEVAAYGSPGYVLYTGEPLGSDVAGADGVALLRVPGGSLRVVASASGYAQREGESVNVGADGARVAVRLQRGGILEGVVVDPEGRTVEGARVGLLRAPAVHLRAITDAEGRFRFEHVPANAARETDVTALRLAIVAVDAPGFVRTWSAGDPPPEGGTETRRVTLLRPQLVRGVVRYEDGSPANNSGIILVGSTAVGDPSWGWSTWATAQGHLALDGTFRFESVVPGDFTIRDGVDSSKEPLARIRVEPEGTPAPLELVVARAPADVWVRVLDLAGRPMPKAAVILLPVAGQGGFGGRRLTGDDGLVRVPRPNEGPWWLFVDAPGAGPLLRRVEPSALTKDPLDVGPGDGVVDGRAERLDGRPAQVRLALSVLLRQDNVSTQLDGWQGAVESGTDGTFRFVGVHEGVTGVRVAGFGWTVFPPSIPGFSSRSRGVTVVVIDELEAARLRLEAELLDAGDLQPLPVQATVLAQREGETAQSPLYAAPGTAGRYRSEGPLEPGRWTLKAHAKGYEEAEVEVVQPRMGGLQPVRILLRKKT